LRHADAVFTRWRFAVEADALTPLLLFGRDEGVGPTLLPMKPGNPELFVGCPQLFVHVLVHFKVVAHRQYERVGVFFLQFFRYLF
jgi:hypothetical protein